MTTVYLAGAMFGLTLEDMNGWRMSVARELLSCGFAVLNPVDTDFGPEPTGREITDSNEFQIRHSDVVLAEFNRETVSIGTVGEVVFAWMINKPVITWGGAVYVEHPWIRERTTRHFASLGDAVDYIVRNYSK